MDDFCNATIRSPNRCPIKATDTIGMVRCITGIITVAVVGGVIIRSVDDTPAMNGLDPETPGIHVAAVIRTIQTLTIRLLVRDDLNLTIRARRTGDRVRR